MEKLTPSPACGGGGGRGVRRTLAFINKAKKEILALARAVL